MKTREYIIIELSEAYEDRNSLIRQVDYDGNDMLMLNIKIKTLEWVLFGEEEIK